LDSLFFGCNEVFLVFGIMKGVAERVDLLVGWSVLTLIYSGTPQNWFVWCVGASFFQCFGAVNVFVFFHGAVMKYFFFDWRTNKCIIGLGAVKKLIISFGALTAIIFTTAVTLIGCC
jgi:hypothetical protein